MRHYQEQGWSYRMIGEHLGVSTAKVRAELQRRGIPAHRSPPIGPGSRASRTEAPIDKVRKLYVESEWSAEDVAAQLDSTVHVVLRTGHAHGVPIRQCGRGSLAVTRQSRSSTASTKTSRSARCRIGIPSRGGPLAPTLRCGSPNRYR